MRGGGGKQEERRLGSVSPGERGDGPFRERIRRPFRTAAVVAVTGEDGARPKRVEEESRRLSTQTIPLFLERLRLQPARRFVRFRAMRVALPKFGMITSVNITLLSKKIQYNYHSYQNE